MSAIRKKSPVELIRNEKKRLNRESDRLVHSVEVRIKYGRENMTSILGASLLETIYPKLPPFVQRLITGCVSEKPVRKGEESPAPGLGLNLLGLIPDALLDILPLFVKGRKGIIVTYLLKGLRGLFSR